MPKLKVTAYWPVLDQDSYIRDLKTAVNQAMIKAARKFLLAAVPLIPIWTGMARGALGNLEDVVGKVSNNRIRTDRKGAKKLKLLQPRNYYYYPPGGTRILRTNLSGRQFATQPAKIFSSGRLTRVSKNSSIIFKFEVDITYFDYLDKEKWHAFEAGKAAFDVELKLQLEKLKPDIGKYIIRREVK